MQISSEISSCIHLYCATSKHSLTLRLDVQLVEQQPFQEDLGLGFHFRSRMDITSTVKLSFCVAHKMGFLWYLCHFWCRGNISFLGDLARFDCVSEWLYISSTLLANVACRFAWRELLHPFPPTPRQADVQSHFSDDEVCLFFAIIFNYASAIYFSLIQSLLWVWGCFSFAKVSVSAVIIITCLIALTTRLEFLVFSTGGEVALVLLGQ